MWTPLGRVMRVNVRVSMQIRWTLTMRNLWAHFWASIDKTMTLLAPHWAHRKDSDTLPSLIWSETNKEIKVQHNKQKLLQPNQLLDPSKPGWWRDSTFQMDWLQPFKADLIYYNSHKWILGYLRLQHRLCKQVGHRWIGLESDCLIWVILQWLTYQK